MGDNKLKIHNTQLDNLISNLRGEVGEILLTWLILRKLQRNANHLSSPDIEKNFENAALTLLEVLIDKLENDIVARFSELAESKTTRLTFYFAQIKLEGKANIKPDVTEFKRFIEKNKFKDRRNQFISHKEIPEKRSDYKEIYIPMQTIGKCLSLAVKLMIKIDKIFLGPSTIYLWRETLKKKGEPLLPLNVNFMLLPYVKLPIETLKKIYKDDLKASPNIENLESNC